MKRLMRFDEAIEKRIVKNLDEVDPNALFPKNIKEVILKPEYTGIEEPQVIFRQDFEFIFFKTRVKRDTNLTILAIGKDSNRNTTIALKGRTGYLWGGSCWREINKLYSNWDNGINAYPISEEYLNLIFERNKTFKGFKFGTWIDKSFRDLMSQGNSKCGIKFVRERTILTKLLWYSDICNQKGDFDYCPMIKICCPSDILVDVTSMKKSGKWKLIPEKGLLKWWYRLFY